MSLGELIGFLFFALCIISPCIAYLNKQHKKVEHTQLMMSTIRNTAYRKCKTGTFDIEYSPQIYIAELFGYILHLQDKPDDDRVLIHLSNRLEGLYDDHILQRTTNDQELFTAWREYVKAIEMKREKRIDEATRKLLSCDD